MTKNNNEFSVSLPIEVWKLVYDLLKVKQYSLEQDITRAYNSGSIDYAQVLLDSASKCKEACDELQLNLPPQLN